MLYSVFVKENGQGEWQKLAWDLCKKEAQGLVLSVTAHTKSTAEYRPQDTCETTGDNHVPVLQ